jgi:hypothetical protein
VLVEVFQEIRLIKSFLLEILVAIKIQWLFPAQNPKGEPLVLDIDFEISNQLASFLVSIGCEIRMAFIQDMHQFK